MAGEVPGKVGCGVVRIVIEREMEIWRGAVDAELVLCVCVLFEPLHLFLLPMEAEHREPGPERREGCVHERDLLARGEEYDRLLLEMRPYKVPEHVELLSELDEHKVVREARGRGAAAGLLMHGEVLRLAQRETREVRSLASLRRREEHRLPPFGQRLDDRLHRRLEAQIKEAVGFIENEDLQIVRIEPCGRIHVL